MGNWHFMIMKSRIDWPKTSPHAGPPIELAALETLVEDDELWERNRVRVIRLMRHRGQYPLNSTVFEALSQGLAEETRNVANHREIVKC
jgi:hypothetical protein